MARNVEVPEYAVHEDLSVDPRRAVLLVVDMENDFVKEGGALVVPDAAATIPRIAHLLGLAREAGMKVAFSQDTHDDGDPEWAIWGEHVRRGSWGWQIIDELAPREDELVVRKVRYDAFYGTQLDHFLRLWGVETLVICGTVANICVHYTAASAALRWYDVIIPRDSISALEVFDLESSLRQTAFLFAGKVTTTDALEVVRHSSTSRFDSAAGREPVVEQRLQRVGDRGDILVAAQHGVRAGGQLVERPPPASCGLPAVVAISALLA